MKNAKKYKGRKVRCIMHLNNIDDVVEINIVRTLEDFKSDIHNALAKYDEIEIIEDNINLYYCQLVRGISAINETRQFFWNKGIYRYDTFLTKEEIKEKLKDYYIAVEGLQEITENDLVKLT